MLKQLRFKFVCINMAIISLFLCSIFSLLIFSTQHRMEGNCNWLLETVNNGTHTQALLEARPSTAHLPHFTIQLDTQGNLLSVQDDSYPILSTIPLDEVLRAAVSAPKDIGYLKDYHLRYYRSFHAQGPLISFADVSVQQATMRALMKSCAIIGVVAFLALLIISILLSYLAVKPVEQSWKQQKQFVADASHELKTPLTVILTNAEMLQSPEYDENTRQQLSSNILTMSHQMRSLVEALLELARVDNHIIRNSFTELDFSQVVSDAVLPFEPLFFEKDMMFQTQIDENIHVPGNEPYLQHTVEILLDNAMKYASPHALVTVNLHRKGNHCLLSVGNTGSAIPPEDMKHIFKRFYRVNKARSMNRSYGLGLPIAKGIVKDHRGKIWVESAHGFNTFYIQLPVV